MTSVERRHLKYKNEHWRWRYSMYEIKSLHDYNSTHHQ